MQAGWWASWRGQRVHPSALGPGPPFDSFFSFLAESVKLEVIGPGPLGLRELEPRALPLPTGTTLDSKLLQEGEPLPGPKSGSCLTLGNELSEEIHVLTSKRLYWEGT